MIRKATERYSENPNHKFIEQKLYMVIIRTLPVGIGVSDNIKVLYKFCTMFM